MPQSLLKYPSKLKEATSSELADWERIKSEEDAKDTSFKSRSFKTLQSGMESLGGVLSGYAGIDQVDRSKPKTPYNYGTAIGEIGSAGLPFLSYKGLKNIAKSPAVFHGAQRVFDKFDSSKNDVTDVLGWLTHFAESPEYSSHGYAMGHMKGMKSVDEMDFNPLTKEDLTVPDIPYFKDRNQQVKPWMIPAVIENKNTLDLVDPNADDISHALAQLPAYDRKQLINEFKKSRQDPANTFFRSDHYPEGVPDNEKPVRSVAEQLRLRPEQFESSPFDAIRYNDMDQKSWAVPSDTPIRSSFGAPMTNELPSSKLRYRVMELDEPTGNLPIPSNKQLFKKAQPPKPEIYKLPPNSEEMKLVHPSSSINKYKSIKEIPNKPNIIDDDTPGLSDNGKFKPGVYGMTDKDGEYVTFNSTGNDFDNETLMLHLNSGYIINDWSK